MEKIKITNEATEQKWEVYIDSLGKKAPFSVKNYISYDEMSDAANEIVLMSVVIDNDTGCVYRMHNRDIVEAMVFCKYFTNIEVTTFEDFKKTYEWFFANGIDTCFEVEVSQMQSIIMMANRIEESIRKINETKSSIGYKLGVSFSSVLKDTDIADDIAKNAEVNNMLVDLMDSSKKQKEKSRVKTVPGAVGGLVNVSKRK